MGHDRPGRYGAESHIDHGHESDSRFEIPAERKTLHEIYNSNRPESEDKGAGYIKELVKLQGNIKFLLENGSYTQSELVSVLKYGKKEAFVVGVALDYMQRMGAVRILKSKPGPEKNTVEPIYSLNPKN